MDNDVSEGVNVNEANVKKYGKIYLSGPMTGMPDHNFPEFNRLAKKLRLAGFGVFNPAENADGDTTKPREFYMRLDIGMVLKSDSIMLLDGWRKSKGAVLEVAIGKELNLPIIYEDFTELEDETICEEADYLVSEDRGSCYGHPLFDFTRTGRIWGAILDIPDVPPELVGLCMIGVKLSRETHLHKRDNLVDAAGYAKTVDMIMKRKMSKK